MLKMGPTHLVIFSVTLTVFSISSVKVFAVETNNLLAVGSNNEPPLSFIEFYDAETGLWKALQTPNFSITDYGVVLYKNRLLLIGGRHHSDGKTTNEVNEVDLLSGRIETVNYMKLIEPKTNPSVVVVGEGKSTAIFILGGKFENGTVSRNFYRWAESARQWIWCRSINFEGAAVVVHKNDIYVFGGFDGNQYTNNVQFYNVTTDRWTLKKSMNEAKGNFHGVSDGKYIYVLGGFSNHSDPNSALNGVDRYDPDNDTWISIANIQHCNGNVGVNLLNSQLYAIGGTNCSRTQIYHENNNTWNYLSSLTYDRLSHTVVKVPFELQNYRFDWSPRNRSMKDILLIGTPKTENKYSMELYKPEDGSWRVIKHENTTTDYQTSAFINDRLIIAGGYNASGSDSNEVFEIFLDTGKVLKLSPMNEARKNLRLVTVGEGKSARLYAIGGYNTPRFNQKSVERWDPSNNAWEFVSPMNGERTNIAAVVHDGNIFVIGGHRDYDYHYYNEVYLVVEDRWEFRAPMLHGKKNCSAISDGKYIYVVGGFDEKDNPSSNVQRYDPSTDTWKELASTSSYGLMGISLLENAPVVFGGLVSNNTETDIVEIYDAEKDEWRTLGSMNFKREIYTALNVPWKWKYSNL